MTDRGDENGTAAGPVAAPSRREVAAAVTVLAVLVAIAVRRSLGLATADSILYGLISTEQLTLFFWGQDRLANVVPAVAWPVQEIRWNYLLQTSIIAASFFVLVGLLVWFHATRRRGPASWSVIVASTAITSAASIALLTRHGVYTFVLEQQYALSTLLYLLGLGGVTAVGRRAQAAGALAILAATLIIPSTVLLLPVVLVVRRGPGLVRRCVSAGTVSVVAFVMTSVASRWLSDGFEYTDAYSDFSLGRLRLGFEKVANNIADSTQKPFTLLAALVCIAVLVTRRRTFDRTLLLALVGCPVMAFAWIALFSTNAWVELNLYLYRYFFPAYAAALMVLAAGVTELVAAAAGRLPSGRPSRARTAIAAAVAGVAVIGATIVVRATDVPALDAGRGLADLAATQDAHVVVGDYWQAWPAVFASREAGADLMAATLRSEHVVDDIVASADADATTTVLCLIADPAICIDELANATGRSWTAVTTRSTAPLVIEVALDR